MYKSTLRRKYKHLRDNIDPVQRQNAEAIITDKVTSMAEFTACDILFTFISSGSEISTAAIMDKARQLDKKLAAPVVTGKHDMCFIYISSVDGLKPGAYGILEPEFDKNKIALPTAKSFMLVPGFAFDASLNRLGYGGGYYDKYMAENPIVYKAGIGFYSQYTQSLLPHDDYDVPLDILITEKMIKKGVRK